MHRIVVVCVFLLALCSAVQAQTLPPSAFTEKFAKSLGAAVAPASVSVAKELQLTMQRANSSQVTINLTNAYRDYTASPARFDDLVKTVASSLTQPAAAKLDRARIVPVIKDRAWLKELAQSFAPGQEALYDDFNKELVIVYAEDSDTRMRYLSTRDDVGDRSALRALAISNLKRILPKIEQRRHDDTISIISVGGDYEASLLLLDDIWSSGQIKFDGDLVVAIPARDALLVTGSKNRKGLKAMRETVADLVKGPHHLIDTLFVYRNGKFVKFGRD